MRAVTLAAVGAALAGVATAGSLAGAEAAPSASHAGSDGLVVSAARIFDGRRLRTNAAVLIRDGRIVRVGTLGALRELARRRVSLGDATILPGFIDLHVHVESPYLVRGGLTTVRNLGQSLRAISPPRDRPGEQRLRGAGPIVSVPGGYPGNVWGASIHASVRQPDEAERVVARAISAGASAIKVALEPGPGDWPMLSPEELEAVVAAAHRRGRPVTAHVSRIDELEQALAAGVDELAHMPCDRPDPGAMRDAARRGLRIVGTLRVIGSTSRCPAAMANARAFVRAGGNLLYGTDYGVPGIPPGIVLAELRLLERAGLSRLEAFAAATSRAGKALREAPLGSLGPGAPADLFAVRGNPFRDLEALTSPVLAIAGGKRVL